MTWLVQINKTCASSKIFRVVEVDIGAIVSASDIRQEEIRLRQNLSEGTATVRCQNNNVNGDIIAMTESVLTIAKLGTQAWMQQ